jgi:protein O-mannosyl-transferase
LAESSPPDRESRARRPAFRAPRPWLLLCVVVIVTIVSYLPVLGAPFVWDDHHLIEDSPLTEELHPLRDYFGHGFWQTDELGRGRAFYRPLTILSLAIDHELYGDGAGGYHLSNLVAHVVSTALLFRLLCVRGASGPAAALGAALWSLYPRLTEAVAWISGRTDVLATCFVLAALIVQARPGVARRIACGFLLFLGLLCKEVALAGVGAVLVLELVPAGALLARAWRVVPALLALGGYALLRALASGVTATTAVPLGTLLFRASAALGQYFVMFLTPWSPNVQIGQLSKPNPAHAVLGCVVLLALGVLLIRLSGRLTLAAWSALTLSALGLGLVLHIVPFFSNVIAADRFLYLPLAGIVLFLTPALATLVQANANELAAACALLSLSFVGATFLRAAAWADEVTLWSKTFRDNPDNQHVACTQLGRLYAGAGLLTQALSLYRGCAVTSNSRFILLSNAAAVLARAGRYREALAQLDDLGEPARQKPLVILNQALLYAQLADFGAARAAVARALNVDPHSASALSLSRQLPSVERARQQLDAMPNSAPALERARLLRDLGLSSEALRAWQQAFASGSLSREQFREGLTFALGQGDEATVELLHREYPAQFEPAQSQELTRAYSARHELSLQLLAIWPSLGVPLRALPGADGF